jgi:chorismate lyase/3-hydroxybenzoate synthase
MTFTFAFGDSGDESKGVLGTGIPLLGGEPREAVLGPVEPAGREGTFTLWRGPEGLAGFSRTEPGDDFEGVTRQIYGDLLRAVGPLHLYRIWNLVPRINATGTGDLENYRSFCRGRSLAFEEGLGRAFTRRLPAASAVGTEDAGLMVAFVAGSTPPQHFENPQQLPAYQYPAEHGPRPPSFARATVVERQGKLDVFISGTSAIVGHATVAPHNTEGQLDCTIKNLGLISQACGLGENLGREGPAHRHFKVYLRKPEDRPAVALEMDRRVLRGGDRVSYLGADICRSELNVEIEAAIRGAARS